MQTLYTQKPNAQLAVLSPVEVQRRLDLDAPDVHRVFDVDQNDRDEWFRNQYDQGDWIVATSYKNLSRRFGAYIRAVFDNALTVKPAGLPSDKLIQRYYYWFATNEALINEGLDPELVLPSIKHSAALRAVTNTLTSKKQQYKVMILAIKYGNKKYMRYPTSTELANIAKDFMPNQSFTNGPKIAFISKDQVTDEGYHQMKNLMRKLITAETNGIDVLNPSFIMDIIKETKVIHKNHYAAMELYYLAVFHDDLLVGIIHQKSRRNKFDHWVPIDLTLETMMTQYNDIEYKMEPLTCQERQFNNLMNEAKNLLTKDQIVYPILKTDLDYIGHLDNVYLDDLID